MSESQPNKPFEPDKFREQAVQSLLTLDNKQEHPLYEGILFPDGPIEQKIKLKDDREVTLYTGTAKNLENIEMYSGQHHLLGSAEELIQRYIVGLSDAEMNPNEATISNMQRNRRVTSWTIAIDTEGKVIGVGSISLPAIATSGNISGARNVFPVENIAIADGWRNIGLGTHLLKARIMIGYNAIKRLIQDETSRERLIDANLQLGEYRANNNREEYSRKIEREKITSELRKVAQAIEKPLFFTSLINVNSGYIRNFVEVMANQGYGETDDAKEFILPDQPISKISIMKTTNITGKDIVEFMLESRYNPSSSIPGLNYNITLASQNRLLETKLKFSTNKINDLSQNVIETLGSNKTEIDPPTLEEDEFTVLYYQGTLTDEQIQHIKGLIEGEIFESPITQTIRMAFGPIVEN